ncbi:unnamed protein product [Musa hybrid cultivar]
MGSRNTIHGILAVNHAGTEHMKRLESGQVWQKHIFLCWERQKGEAWRLS